ncbi:DUF7544 domain-containing protein [Streptomyces sp. GS7]|uniref:DUF7544 domain-containing protein n=1 Tax=Streptomyces sp. GS7 TaxID=2692234 RepID=UPI0013187E9F|nr:hypothetical protein [Streptomyces sp. GS7]QHC20792.1 hypothetical protein GR130_04460 [Streptomyces sp. GS7]
MDNSPGWASPGSAPSGEPDRGTQEQPPQPSGPEDHPGGASEQPAHPNWASKQPPAGQWTAPAGIPGQSGPGGRGAKGTTGDRTRASSGGSAAPGWGTPPGPGKQATWGAGPGWGGGWAAMPPAAKPGVIPLRPLGVGEILDGAVATMRAHWRTVLSISLIVAIVSQTANTIVTGVWLQGTGHNPALDAGGNPPLRQALSDMSDSLAGSAISSLIRLLATIIATGLLTMVVSRAVLGRPATAGEAWREARGQLPRLLGLLVLLPLLITAVFAVGMVPGLVVMAGGSFATGLTLTLLGGLAATVVSIWLGVRYSLASPALMLEKQGVIAAMRRSAKLVRGAWWRVLGVQLLAYLLVAIVQFIIQIPATLIAFIIGGENLMDWANGTSNGTGWPFLIVLGIGAIISSTITFPISAGVTVLVYVDQRIRREALDLELARAAGLPGYDTEPATPAPATTGPTTTPAPRPPADAPPADGPTADSPSDSTEEQPTADQQTEHHLTKTQPAAARKEAPDSATATGTDTSAAANAPKDASADIPGPRPSDATPGG